MSDGKVCDTVPSVILRLETDGGITGWGEVCPSALSRSICRWVARRLKVTLGPAGGDALASDALMDRAISICLAMSMPISHRWRSGMCSARRRECRFTSCWVAGGRKQCRSIFDHLCRSDEMAKMAKRAQQAFASFESSSMIRTMKPISPACGWCVKQLAPARSSMVTELWGNTAECHPRRPGGA